MKRRYELRLTPAEAIEQLQRSEGNRQLHHGMLQALGHRVIGSLAGNASQVVLTGCLVREGGPELTASLTVDLVPTEHGCEFTLIPRAKGPSIAPEMRTVTIFSAVVVGILGVMYWPVALTVALIYLLINSLVWLTGRRYALAARQCLVDVMWRAWSPALVGSERSGYRALPVAEAA